MVAPLILDASTLQPMKGGGDILNVISRIAFSSSGRVDGARRFGAPWVTPSVDAIDRFRKRSDGAFIQDLVRQDARLHGRTDALEGAAGGFPRDFEFMYEEILEEPRRPLNHSRLWQNDTRVPLGAKTHTVRRDLNSGDAKVTRTGTEIPVVRGSREEETFPVIYIAAAVEVNWFEQISNDFEGRNQFASDTRHALRVIDEKVNEIAFGGHAPSNMFGYLNYPHLAKSTSTQLYTAGGIIAAKENVVADLNAIANFPIEASGGIFQPNRMATSIRVRNRLFQTRNSDSSDTSIARFFLDGHETINEIVGVQELQGVGPNGEDAITVYDDSIQSTTLVMVQAPTAMPAFQIDSFRNQVVYIAAIGGVVMRDVGNNHLRFVPA